MRGSSTATLVGPRPRTTTTVARAAAASTLDADTDDDLLPYTGESFYDLLGCVSAVAPKGMALIDKSDSLWVRMGATTTLHSPMACSMVLSAPSLQPPTQHTSQLTKRCCIQAVKHISSCFPVGESS